jgi:hypothetical protein
MVAPVNGVTMVEYTWQKRKVSARLSRLNAQSAKSEIIRQRRIVETILTGWS